ncbi:hypothetical protein Halhy_6710 (plasmid) [Haliscomenobacter hydrossis DSM 1100]|uniref:Uncharacterized protein n=2 Tax=Haliscomenobacter TaxID=2349 RepID=F4L817_HALH1|nr:hypothetical protein Halhy_6710 [Haliscomenobacter hydrossis DSM 1100]
MMSKNINYDHAEHLHRFACWTAAAAVRRAFVGNEVIARVIEDINLKQELFELKKAEPSAEKFDEKHKEYSNRLVTRLKELLNSQAEKDKVTYGRAAKIIAVYIKTCYVIPDPECALSRVAHPPIDRILLTNLSKCEKINFDKFPAWTKLSPKEYVELIKSLRRIEPDHFWKLERYWQSH